MIISNAISFTLRAKSVTEIAPDEFEPRIVQPAA